jgi:SAM-dependent methyltransferase|nr:class I SAM-dependent methyltransferase [Kofleriaceae bacterium]
MTYVMYILAALLVFDALRMRGRVGALTTLARTPSDDPATHIAIAAPGVTVDDATLRAASAHMRAAKLDVLDLVPRDLPAIRAMTLAQLVDPPKYRGDRMQPGRTAGHALILSRELATRAQAPGWSDTSPTSDDRRAGLDAQARAADTVAFTRLAVRLKHYGAADLAIAPGEHARPVDVGARFQVLRILLGPTTTLALIALPIMLALLALGCWLAPTAGYVAAGAWSLQPLIGLAGTRLAPRDLIVATLFRAPLELILLLRTVFGRRPNDDASSRRAAYDAEMARGTERLLDARRDTCPICSSPDLAVHLRHGDLFQHKPGRFTLERCRGCGHIFQNPRLSIDGLAFYYRDFYDGLGEDGMEFVFGYGVDPYLQRARMVKAAELAPKRWLDIGAGHGHFCMAARAELPGTTFDGLDFGDSIAEAERRGWVDTAYRGMFPELAKDFAGRYDALSMSHYLEHTLDPRAEIDAAATALAPGGCLLIEVPDPEFWLGRALGRWWLPWFQPQHQHLLSTTNLDKLLRERGFEPAVWHRGAAHQKVDFFFAAYLLLDRIAPQPHLPWRWRGGAGAAWRVIAWTLGSPLIFGGIVIDNLIGPLLRRAKVSNTYRVLAIRR